MLLIPTYTDTDLDKIFMNIIYEGIHYYSAIPFDRDIQTDISLTTISHLRDECLYTRLDRNLTQFI